MFDRAPLLRGLLAAAIVLAGCRGRAGNHDGGEHVASKGRFRVAILLPGPHDDHEWSQAGFEGLMLIQQELSAEVAYRENLREDQFADAFRAYAGDGFNLIIGHGGEFVHAAEVVADEFPRTKFAVVALYPGNNRNLGAIRFREGEIGYLTGAVAGLRTHTKKVVYIGGVAYKHLQEQAALFVRGAHGVDASIEVSVVWLDSWTDEAKARATALAYLQKGYDVLSVNADKAGLSVMDEARRAGAYAVGWNLDQHELAPQTVVTSGIQRIPVLLLEGARLVREGRWEGKQYKFGLREGAQDLAPFYGLLSEEQAQVVARLKDAILAGRIDLSYQEGASGPP